MRVGLFIGELCEAPADVIWTSTSPHLSSIRGADAVIRKCGGSELQQACNGILDREQTRTGNRFLPAGSAAATLPGPLPFQAVVHCIAFDAQGSSPDVITTCAQNAWMTTSALRPRPQRVALPVLAADNGKFDLEAALRLIADALHGAPPAPIDVLWIVLPDRQHEAAARSILEQRFGSVESHPAASKTS